MKYQTADELEWWFYQACEDPGCHWSREPSGLVVEMLLEVTAGHADCCIEIDSDSDVTRKESRGQFKNCLSS